MGDEYSGDNIGGIDVNVDVPSDTNSDIGGDIDPHYGGELDSIAGVDLNSEIEAPMSHREQFRGHIGDALHGAAQWSGENPLQAHENPYIYGGRMALGQSESLGQAAYHYPAAQMEAAIDLHGPSTSVEHNHGLIAQELDEHKAAGMTSEPLADGEPIYDSETGIDLTDERLQGYENPDD